VAGLSGAGVRLPLPRALRVETCAGLSGSCGFGTGVDVLLPFLGSGGGVRVPPSGSDEESKLCQNLLLISIHYCVHIIHSLKSMKKKYH